MKRHILSVNSERISNGSEERWSKTSPRRGPKNVDLNKSGIPSARSLLPVQFEQEEMDPEEIMPTQNTPSVVGNSIFQKRLSLEFLKKGLETYFFLNFTKDPPSTRPERNIILRATVEVESGGSTKNLPETPRRFIGIEQRLDHDHGLFIA